MKIYSITDPNNPNPNTIADYSRQTLHLNYSGNMPAYIMGVNHNLSEVNPAQLLRDIYENLKPFVHHPDNFILYSGVCENVKPLKLKLHLTQEEVKAIQEIYNSNLTDYLTVNQNYKDMFIFDYHSFISDYSGFLNIQKHKTGVELYELIIEQKCLHLNSKQSYGGLINIKTLDEIKQKEILSLFKSFTDKEFDLKILDSDLFNIKYEYSQILKICQALVHLEKDFILLIDEMDSGLLKPQGFFNQLRKEIFKRNGQLIFSSRCEDIHNVCAREDYFSNYSISFS